MTELLTLGDLYVSDFLAPDEEPRSEPWPLRLVMDDDTGIVHLAEQPPAELMWGRYWYRSGTNASMRRALHDVVESVNHVTTLRPGDVWVDIACNDGTLLEAVRSSRTPGGNALPDTHRTSASGDATLLLIGVDPVEGAIADEARERCDAFHQQPFTSAAAAMIRRDHGPTSVITCAAMFYDLLDPTDFLAGVKNLLADDGVFVLQMSYTPLMLEQLAFDNICHEHACYYSMQTLHETLTRAGFAVVDATLNDVNGGSLRVFARHADADPKGWASAPYRDVATYRMRALAAEEVRGGWNTPVAWRWFRQRLDELRCEVRSHIKGLRSAGRSVFAYGASTKGNTLLQYFGLDHTLIDGIAERQEAKWGLRTVGTDIPIVSEDEWRAARPHSTLMLPWHFVSSFVERERKYLEDGGRFIVPCPRFEVIGG